MLNVKTLRFAPAILSLAIAVLGASRATAQWVDGGVPLSGSLGGKFSLGAASDCLGGAFFAWLTLTPGEPGNTNIFAQHLRHDGSIDPRWPEDGLPVCVAAGTQYMGEIIADGAGGAFIAWSDYRNPPPDSARVYAVYLQRVTAAGTLATGWPTDGLLVCDGACTEGSPELVPDGAGGVFAVWPSDTLIPPMYAEPGGFRASRVTGDGVLAAGWPPEGVPIATSATLQRLRSVLPDGAGGFYAIADGGIRPYTYCHRVTPDGTPAPGWPSDGIEVSTGWGATAAPDGEGGLFFFWSSFFASEPSAGIYALRLQADGSPAVGWPASGLRISPDEANEPPNSVATSDGGGIVLWVHFGQGISVRAQKVIPTGFIAVGWPEGGVQVTAVQDFLQGVVGVSDGLGGVYLAWEFNGSAPPGVPPPTGTIAQHLTSNGSPAPGWPSGGLALSTSALQAREPAMAPVGGNAAVVAWIGYFGGSGNRIMAQKLIQGGIESFALLLTGFDAKPNRVRLQWVASPTADIPVSIYRREEDDPWQLQGVARPDLMGLLTFEDSNVLPEKVYSYRVSVRTGGEEHFYGQANVRVPAFLLALRLASPNPVRGELTAVVELPTSATAWIELIDARGRIVKRREIGESGPAILRVPLLTGERLASGVYFLRLVQGGKAVTRRAVLVH